MICWPRRAPAFATSRVSSAFGRRRFGIGSVAGVARRNSVASANNGDAAIAQRLADAPRPGAPATFTPEQICAIVALACEQPAAESDLPLSHWSRSELARCAVERGIVERISRSSVGRFFKTSRASAAPRAGVAHAQARS